MFVNDWLTSPQFSRASLLDGSFFYASSGTATETFFHGIYDRCVLARQAWGKCFQMRVEETTGIAKSV